MRGDDTASGTRLGAAAKHVLKSSLPPLPRARVHTQVVVVHVPPPRAGNQRSEGDSVTLRLLLSAAHANALCFLLAPYSESAGPAPAACFQDTCAPKARSGGQARTWAAIIWMCP